MVRILSSSAFICPKVHLFPILPCVFYLASRLSANSQALVCQIAAGPWQLGGIQWSLVPVAFQMHAVSLQPCLGRSQTPSHLQQQIIVFILLCLCVERFTKLRNRGLSSESVPNQRTMQWINKWEANNLCLQCESISSHQEGSLREYLILTEIKWEVCVEIVLRLGNDDARLRRGGCVWWRTVDVIRMRVFADSAVARRRWPNWRPRSRVAPTYKCIEEVLVSLGRHHHLPIENTGWWRWDFKYFYCRKQKTIFRRTVSVHSMKLLTVLQNICVPQ